jgi:hypothetical protein
MQKKITFRLDDELRELLNKVPYLDKYNISILARKGFRHIVGEILSIDNSEKKYMLEKE